MALQGGQAGFLEQVALVGVQGEQVAFLELGLLSEQVLVGALGCKVLLEGTHMASEDAGIHKALRVDSRAAFLVLGGSLGLLLRALELRLLQLGLLPLLQVQNREVFLLPD